MTPQSTLEFVTDYISDARILLQDVVSPFRYDDPSLLVALNVTMLEGRRVRPDLFVYNLTAKGAVPSFLANDQTAVDMEPQFRLAFLFGLVAHALMRDQEDVQDQRGNTFMALFNSILVGVSPTPVVGTNPPGRNQGQATQGGPQ